MREGQLRAFLLAFFPVAVNVAVGLATLEAELRDVLRALGASPWQIFVKVGAPRTMPMFFASLKVAISSAFVGSVISETVRLETSLAVARSMMARCRATCDRFCRASTAAASCRALAPVRPARTASAILRAPSVGRFHSRPRDPLR